MPGNLLRLTLTGEDPIDVRPKIVGLIAAERKGFADDSIEGGVYAVWVTLGKPDGDFDKWTARIEDFEPVTADGSDPTVAAPNAVSLPSPPPPG